MQGTCKDRQSISNLSENISERIWGTWTFQFPWYLYPAAQSSSRLFSTPHLSFFANMTSILVKLCKICDIKYVNIDYVIQRGLIEDYYGLHNYGDWIEKHINVDSTTFYGRVSYSLNLRKNKLFPSIVVTSNFRMFWHRHRKQGKLFKSTCTLKYVWSIRLFSLCSLSL